MSNCTRINIIAIIVSKEEDELLFPQWASHPQESTTTDELVCNLYVRNVFPVFPFSKRTKREVRSTFANNWCSSKQKHKNVERVYERSYLLITLFNYKLLFNYDLTFTDIFVRSDIKFLLTSNNFNCQNQWLEKVLSIIDFIDSIDFLKLMVISNSG